MGARGIRRGHPVVARLCPDAFPGARRWQNAREMRSPASDGDKVLARCVPGRFAVARFRRGAFPGGNPWQVLRSMHPERGLGRENRQFVARFARHASEMSWLWQDMRAMHPKSPANRRRRIHRVNILPGRGPFRCTGPSNHARRANLAIQRRRSALAPATPAPPTSAKPPAHPQPQRRRTARAAHNHAAALMAAHHPQHSRCQRQPHRKRSHTPPPRDTEASGGREILRRPSPAAPKRSSGTNGTAAPHGAIWPQHPQRRWRHQTRCEP